MIAFWVDLSISNKKNDVTAFFFYTKSATNTFLVLIIQIFKRLTNLILQTRQQSSKAFLNNSKLEIWKPDKFYKLNKHHTIYIPVMVTSITKQIPINAVIGIMTEADILGAPFFKVCYKDIAARYLDIDSLKTLNILKIKLGRQMPKKNKIVIKKLLI